MPFVAAYKTPARYQKKIILKFAVSTAKKHRNYSPPPRFLTYKKAAKKSAASTAHRQERFSFNFLLKRTEQKSGPHIVQNSEPC